jgi:hypothetical protein
VIERDETDEPLPGELVGSDHHLASLISELIGLVFERLPDTSSAEHRGVMTAVLDLHRHLRERGGVRRLQ